MRKADVVILFETRELIVPHDSRFDDDFVQESCWQFTAKWEVDGEDLMEFCRLLDLDVGKPSRLHSILIREDEFIRWGCSSVKAEITNGILWLVLGDEGEEREYSYSGRFMVYWKEEES